MPIGKGKIARRCHDCDKRYIPNGRFQKYCKKCQERRINLKGINPK